MKLLLPIVIVILIVGYFLAGQSLIQKKTTQEVSSSPTLSSQEPKTFQSKSMKFSVDVPVSFLIKENLTYIDLENNKGKVNISKNSTNFNDVDNYVQDFDNKRIGITVVEKEKLKINGLETLKRAEKFTTGPVKQQKIYYIYVDNKVYTISTASEALYSDLDQIAQSFRYIP